MQPVFSVPVLFAVHFISTRGGGGKKKKKEKKREKNLKKKKTI